MQGEGDNILMDKLKFSWLIKQPVAWLILIYGVSVIAKIVLSLFVKSPYIHGDELHYIQMAESFFDSGRFLKYGHPTNVYPPLYPMQISGAFIFKDIATTYTAMKIINAFISSSIIIPVWLLSRNFLNEKESITLAIMTVIVPGFVVYSSVIMSENLFYPLFIFTIYLIYASVTKNDIKMDILCGFSIGLCYLTKITGIVVFITFVIVLLLEIVLKTKKDAKIKRSQQNPKNRIKYHVAFAKHVIYELIKKKWAVFLAAGLTVLPWLIRNALHFGFSLRGIIGRYSDEIEVLNTIDFSIITYLYYVLTHFSYLTIATGIIFFATSMLLLCAFLNKKQSSEKSNDLLIFVTMSWILCVLLILVSSYHVCITSITHEGYHRIQGRYIDPVLPLFLIMGFTGLKHIFKEHRSDYAQYFHKSLFASLIICSVLLAFSPLSFLHAQAITSAPDILFLNIFEMLNIPIIIAKSCLVVLPFTFLMLYRFRLLRIKYLAPIFAIFLLCSSSVAYSYNVNMSHWIDDDMEIGKWLYSNDKRESVILLDERDGDKSRIVQLGIKFWTNDEVIVGDATPNNYKFDFGTPKSPAAPGYIQITAPFTNSTAYKPRIGFGWLTAYHVDA